MNDCIFCKIIKGDIPSYTVYEDDQIKAFLDVNPNSNGHLLVIPKEHKATLLEMEEQTVLHLFEVIKKELYPKLKKDLQIDGLTLCQNNFYGQEVPHFHIHLIPRYKEDQLKTVYQKENLKEVDAIYELLK